MESQSSVQGRSPRTVAVGTALMVLALNLFLVGLAAWELQRSHDHAVQLAQLTAENLSGVLEQGLTRFIDKVDLTLQDVLDEIQREQAAGGIDREELTRFLARHEERLPEAMGLRVVNAEGHLDYAANLVAAPQASIAGVEGFEHWKNSNDTSLFISSPMRGVFSGLPLITMSRRRTDAQGRFAGQVHVAVGLDALVRMFSVAHLGESGSVTLADANGRILARHPNPGGLAGLINTPIVLPTLQKQIKEHRLKDTYHTQSAVDQVDRTYVFHKLENRPLYLLVGIADDDSLEGWRHDAVTTGGLCLLFILLTGGGGIVGYRGWLARHRAAEQLAAKEASLALFRDVLEKSNDAILIIDLETSAILDFNLTACEQLMRRPDEMRRLTICDIDPDLSDPDSWRQFVRGTPQMEAGRSLMFERTHCRPNGETFPVEISWRTVDVDGRRLGISIEREISDRKKFERRIAELSELNEQIIAESVLGLIAFRQNGDCILVNQAGAAIMGGPAAQILQHNFRRVESWTPNMLAMADEVLATGKSSKVATFFHSVFGRAFWVEATVSRFFLSGEPHMLIAFADVSERKEAELALEAKTAELEASNEALLQSNADLERFAYVASHDLQTPLRTIVSYTQLLERRSLGRLDGDCLEFLTYIVEGAKRMSRLITDLLEYARVTSQGKPLEAVLAGRAAEFAMDNLQVAIDDSGAVVRMGRLPMVLADETQLVSLFQNLIGNAIKYRHPDRAPAIAINADPIDGGLWRFSVHDNGMGIEPTYFSKIFEIFQRLNPGGKVEGTGVGLAVCQRIVRRFGGDIWVESTLGEGSVFFFTLHSADTKISAIPEA